MFKPNRVGTPRLLQPSNGQATGNVTVGSQLYNISGIVGNVINGTPVGEFGFSALSWNNGAYNIPATSAAAILQQFSVTQPLEGDAVGLELNAGCQIYTDQNVTIQPVCARLETAGVGVLAVVTSNTRQPVYLDDPYNGQISVANPGFHGLTYKEQVVYRGSDIGGTFAHGFLMINNTAAPMSLGALHMNASVRQLMSQTTVGYNDTLR